MNISDYVAEKGITVEVVEDLGWQAGLGEWSERKGEYVGEKWEHNAYRLRLHRTVNPYDGTPDDTYSPVFDWRQGMGIADYPTEQADNILDSLVSDATSYIDAQDFEDFAESLGYDSDSRKAENIYNQCGEMAEWLRVFLNGDLEYVAYELERSRTRRR